MKTSYKLYDVVIVGAGPAGSATAGVLSSAGISVLLLDRKSFPREKVCGDGLTGDSIRMLKHFDIWEEVKSKAFESRKVELFPSESNSFVLDAPVYTLQRKELDDIVRKRAIRSGADFKHAKFTGVLNEVDGINEIEVWDYDLEEYRVFKGKIVILAMGCQPGAFIAQRIFEDINIKPEIVAIRGYCRADWNIEHPLVFFDNKIKGGYVWIFPMGNNEFNVGCGAELGKKEFKKYLYTFLESNKFTAGNKPEWITEPIGAFLKTGLCNLSNSVKGKVLLTGETLGSTYPFTGEGIGKALETGFLTARFVSKILYENNFKLLDEYPEYIDREIGRFYKPYEVAEKVFAKVWLSKITFKLLCKSKRLSICVTNILSENNKRADDLKLLKVLYKIFKPLI